MAAYAALVSISHIIQQLELHPHPPIHLDKLQIQSLTEKLTFLQAFLECYSINGGIKEADHHVLESRIADAAYAAEDIIESHIVDQIIQAHGENISSIVDLYQGLNKVIQDMDLIMRDVMEIKEKRGIIQDDQLHRNLIITGSFRSPSMGHSIMVGFDDVLIEVMDKLTGYQSSRQVIPIVGMGGIGKTTLARNTYVNPLIVQHFDFRGWVTISQEYNTREILLELVLCVETQEDRESSSRMSEHELGEKLYKSLLGRRYLIVMDDIWSVEAWDEVKFFFPDNSNGSRIIITTRVSNLAFQLSGSTGLEMSFLDEEKSWNLLCKNVFGEEDCPVEFEDIGKNIAKNCKGLPLSIVVIGGLLAKSERTQQHWKFIAENLNSIVNLEENERCFKTLRLSYTQLSVHLKPCFLYMGLFPEDHKIRVSDLIKLWVAEGFLKPISGKSLEVAAEEYLNDLIDRNLILVHKFRSNGNIQLCVIHDLLRDLCIKEAEKDNFFRVAKLNSLNIPQDMHAQRRIGIHQSTSTMNYFPQVFDAVRSASLARSLICNMDVVLPALPSRLLRVLNADHKIGYNSEAFSLEDIFQLVNSRYLNILSEPNSRIPSSIYNLWNLQTLLVNHFNGDGVISPLQIWKMPQLRHVKFYRLHLPDPPIDDRGDHDLVLGSLQSLRTVCNFQCGDEVVKRIPNIKKLRIDYEGIEDLSIYHLNNLCRLHKLESLACFFNEISLESTRSQLLQNLSFPRSLKKLTLEGTILHWEDMSTKIGSLPHLQVLKLKRWSGPEWETSEGQFLSLKFLLIDTCYDLKQWTTESTHFPCLEGLVLQGLFRLKEVPSAIGDISTLQSIQLNYCSDSAVISAKEILKEQEDLGNVDLQVRVRLWNKNQELEKLASRDHFRVEIL